MLHANELMIGDLVTFKDCQHEEPVPIKIIAIGFQESRENSCRVQIDWDESYDIMDIDDSIVGIPITPEVLKKSDFEETVDCWFLRWCDKDVWIYEWSESIWVIRYENTEINTPVEQLVVAYVHELQHALRHFGIDKVVRV